MGSAGVTLGMQGGSRGRPHLEVGGGLVHRFSTQLRDLERRDFVAPVIEIGLRPPAPWGRWAVSLRWRWLKLSRLGDGESEFALFLGFIPGTAH